MTRKKIRLLMIDFSLIDTSRLARNMEDALRPTTYCDLTMSRSPPLAKVLIPTKRADAPSSLHGIIDEQYLAGIAEKVGSPSHSERALINENRRSVQSAVKTPWSDKLLSDAFPGRVAIMERSPGLFQCSS